MKGLLEVSLDDIKNALLAAEHSIVKAAENGDVNIDYLIGYQAALETIRLAFGLTTTPSPAPNFPRGVEYRLGGGAENEPG